MQDLSLRGLTARIASAVLMALALGPLAAPAAARDGPLRHRPPASAAKPLPARLAAWPVALAVRPAPRVVILPAPVPRPVLAGPAFDPVPSVQDLPAVAGIWRTPPAEPSVLQLRR